MVAEGFLRAKSFPSTLRSSFDTPPVAGDEVQDRRAGWMSACVVGLRKCATSKFYYSLTTSWFRLYL